MALRKVRGLALAIHPKSINAPIVSSSGMALLHAGAKAKGRAKARTKVVAARSARTANDY